MKFTLTNDAVFAALQAMNVVLQRDAEGETGLRVARVAKALRTAAVEIIEQRERIILKYSEKYPEGHELAGQATPKYKPGTPADQQTPDNVEAIIAGEKNITDDAAMTAELKSLGDGETEIDCPVITFRDLKPLKLPGSCYEPMLWMIDAKPELAVDSKPGRRRAASA